MRNITKSKPPKSLVAYAKARGAYYGGQKAEVTRDIRTSLLAEQGYLCCYCMKRIYTGSNSMKVEHWRSQTRYPQLQLDYGNLLAACTGSTGRSSREQTCDTRKGDADLCFNPADVSHNVEKRIAYKPDGRIYAPGDELFDRQLKDVLNLNQPTLVNNRKAAIEAVKRSLGLKPGSRKKREIEKLLLGIRTPAKNGYLEEYAGAADFYLRTKMESGPI